MKLPKATAQRHVLKQVSRRLRIWLQDWTGHGVTSRSEEHSVSPLPLIPQAVALLAAVFADKLAGFLNGSLAPEASIVLRLTLGLLLLTIANHVVTAKTKVASTTGLVIPEGGGIKTSDRYTYSQRDRLFAKIVVLLFIFFVASSLWQVQQRCTLLATLVIPARSSAESSPLYLEVRSAGGVQRHSVSGREIAFDILGEHTSSWSPRLIWSDGTASEFGSFSGCPADVTRDAENGVGKIIIQHD